MSNAKPYVAVGLGLLSGLFLWLSHRANRRRRLISALPTSHVQGVFIGLVELKGTAECEAPFTSFLAGQVCVLYSWSVSERWRREVTETYTDSEGKTQTRTKIETGSTTVASGGQSAPFYLRDETGVILVHPDGAELRPATLFAKTCTPLDPLYYSKGPPGAIANSTFSRTFSESGIVLHGDVFLMGKARERADIVAAEIAAEKGSPFLLSVVPEEKVLRRLGISLCVWGILGLMAAACAGWLFQDRWQGVFPGAGIFAGAWGLTWMWMVYNSLVDTRNRVRQGWSQVDIQLKRRHDLLPQLVTCVQALCSHEQDLQTAVATLRTQIANSPSADGSGQNLHAVSRTIIGLAESYPELKTDGAFLRLQTQIIETEQRIALARAYFNDIATAYNTRIEVLPDSLIAALTGFKPRPLLEAEDFERAAVTVKLAE